MDLASPKSSRRTETECYNWEECLSVCRLEPSFHRRETPGPREVKSPLIQDHTARERAQGCICISWEPEWNSTLLIPSCPPLCGYLLIFSSPDHMWYCLFLPLIGYTQMLVWSFTWFLHKSDSDLCVMDKLELGRTFKPGWHLPLWASTWGRREAVMEGRWPWLPADTHREVHSACISAPD